MGNFLDDINENDVEASFSEVSEAEGADDTSETLVADVPKPGILINNNQTQIVSQDQTTVNNIFREKVSKDASICKKILIELLLSIIEPDRFLKNAKAIFIILMGIALFCFITSLEFSEAKELLEMYLKNSK